MYLLLNYPYQFNTNSDILIVAGDVSRDGRMVLIKTYYQIILINRNPALPFSSILEEKQSILDYIIEPQGESACWDSNQSGYFTISEQRNNVPVHLLFQLYLVHLLPDKSSLVLLAAPLPYN